MAIEFHDIEMEKYAGSNIIRVKIIGKLLKEDYEVFVPVVEKNMERFGKVRMLVELIDFKGWSAGAAWEDTKFGVKHFTDLEKLALVGDRKWEKGMELFCKVFTTGQVRFFSTEELYKAEEWILE
ncbi:MAG: STAS/SEC14 domain-containing protein [Thermoplasmatota archaeon]